MHTETHIYNAEHYQYLKTKKSRYIFSSMLFANTKTLDFKIIFCLNIQKQRKNRRSQIK